MENLGSFDGNCHFSNQQMDPTAERKAVLFITGAKSDGNSFKTDH